MMQTQRYKIPSTNALLARVLLELLALFCFGYPMLHIYVFLQGDAEPFLRGFYCDGKICYCFSTVSWHNWLIDHKKRCFDNVDNAFVINGK